MELKTNDANLSRPDRYGAWSIDELIADLDSERSVTRCQAAQILGELKNPRAVDPLIMKLGHFDNNTKIAAATALGNIGDKRAIQPLATALGRESLDTLEAIQAALIKLDAQDVLSRELRARNLREGVSAASKPGVMNMFIGGGIIVFSLISLAINYLTSNGVINPYWYGPMILGATIFLRGLIKNLSN